MTDFEPDKTAVFEATIPSIQSAIKIGDGMTRLTLDITEQYLEEAIKLLTMNNQNLDVMIKVRSVDVIEFTGNEDIEFIGNNTEIVE